jgi:prophage regulatory protein
MTFTFFYFGGAKMEDMAAKRERVVRKPEVLSRTGLSDVTVWRLEREGKFPKRVRLGGNSCGWLESEIDAWFAGIAEAR